MGSVLSGPYLTPKFSFAHSGKGVVSGDKQQNFVALQVDTQSMHEFGNNFCNSMKKSKTVVERRTK